MNDYRKNCTQVFIPEVDNTSPCDDFNYSECILVNRDSLLLKNVKDENLNYYMELLENKILKMQNTISLLVKKIDKLQECCGNNINNGIGTFEPD